MKSQHENNMNALHPQQWNELATSLLDFSTASSGKQDDLVDYLSEHLYIQMHISGRCEDDSAADSSQERFYNACHKVYYAEDEQSRRDAIHEARTHLAA